MPLDRDSRLKPMQAAGLIAPAPSCNT